jgi:hypothetical protein
MVADFVPDLVVGQDGILQRVVNPRTLRRFAIGAQVPNLPHIGQGISMARLAAAMDWPSALRTTRRTR